MTTRVESKQHCVILEFAKFRFITFGRSNILNQTQLPSFSLKSYEIIEGGNETGYASLSLKAENGHISKYCTSLIKSKALAMVQQVSKIRKNSSLIIFWILLPNDTLAGILLCRGSL